MMRFYQQANVMFQVFITILIVLMQFDLNEKVKKKKRIEHYETKTNQ